MTPGRPDTKKNAKKKTIDSAALSMPKMRRSARKSSTSLFRTSGVSMLSCG